MLRLFVISLGFVGGRNTISFEKKKKKVGHLNRVADLCCNEKGSG